MEHGEPVPMFPTVSQCAPMFSVTISLGYGPIVEITVKSIEICMPTLYLLRLFH